jgi:hypothetical protein
MISVIPNYNPFLVLVEVSVPEDDQNIDEYTAIQTPIVGWHVVVDEDSGMHCATTPISANPGGYSKEWAVLNTATNDWIDYNGGSSPDVEDLLVYLATETAQHSASGRTPCVD